MASPPALLSFTKLDAPDASPQWRLTFSEPVTGVRTQDVKLYGDGTYFSGASVASLVPEGDGHSWLLSVTAGAGEGKLVPFYTGNGVRDLDGQVIPGTYSQYKTLALSSLGPLVTMDTNGDGILDVVTGDSIRRGVGDGSFGAATALTGGQTGGIPLAIDGNGDGRPDLVAAGASAGSFLAGLPTGGFAAGTSLDLGGAARALFAADVNGDGRSDVVVVPDSGAIRVALQLAGGGFAAATATIAGSSNARYGAAVGDVNGDGRADLAVIDGDVVRMWLGQTGGGFLAGANLPVGLNRSNVSLFDVNSDGRLDLLTQGLNISVRLGDGMGGFGDRIESATRIPDVYTISSSSYYPPQPVSREMVVKAIQDVTGDGIPDLVGASHIPMYYFGSYYVDEAFFAPGLGGGRFGTPVSVASGGTGLGDVVGFADYDNDGRSDFLSAKLPTQGLGGSTGLMLDTTLQTVREVYSDYASRYTPPHLLSITVNTPDAVLHKGDTAIFTLHFDKLVQSYSSSLLQFNNGTVAPAFSTSGDTDISYRYTAGEGESIGDLGVRSIIGTFMNPPSGLAADVSHPPAVAGTLHVDTRTPLYFANDDGRLVAWTFDGLSIFDKVLLSPTGGAGAGAIIHAASADAVFYTTGSLATVSSSMAPGTPTRIGSVEAKWSFVGEGGSGGEAGRVFWHSNLGEVVFWDATTASSPRAWLGQASLDWRVAAIADITGDGAADVIFQNQDGTVAAWQVGGSAVVAKAVIDVVTPDWKLVAAGDLNGDGMADLVYRNTADTRVVARLMNGFETIGGNQAVGGASLDWSVADLRDMNGDGREDILWRSTSGGFAVWAMDGTQVMATKLLDSVSADWHLLT